MNTIEGFPVSSSAGRLLQVEIRGEKKEMQDGDDFVENYPPKAGDPLFRVQGGTKKAVSFVLKEQGKPTIGRNLQCWEVEEVR